jgi:phosphatidylserine/phosphatidylglycerophosphate/cardiolipin synthase-like enzyme
VLDLMALELPDHHCKIEAGNRPWGEAHEGVGTPQLAGGDKLHHKFAVLDGRRLISGSFNWSPSAAHQNDETLLRIDSPLLARHFEAEMDRLWRGAELGMTERLERRRQRISRRCGWVRRERVGRERDAEKSGAEKRGKVEKMPTESAAKPWIRPPAPAPSHHSSTPSI